MVCNYKINYINAITINYFIVSSALLPSFIGEGGCMSADKNENRYKRSPSNLPHGGKGSRFSCKTLNVCHHWVHVNMVSRHFVRIKSQRACSWG